MGKKRGKGKGNSNTQKSAESAAAAASPESVSPSSADPPAAAAAVEESADPVKALLDNPESVKEPESVSNPFLSFLPSTPPVLSFLSSPVPTPRREATSPDDCVRQFLS